MGKIERRKNKRKMKRIILSSAAVIMVGLAVTVFFLFRVQKITYQGSDHYSEEELKEYIFGSKEPNALLHYLTGQNSVQIPFIQKYDVEIEWPDKMHVMVYEKSIIGYVSYMGCNMYFDKDGIVVDSSTEILPDIPQITGLDFDSIILNSKLKTKNDTVFEDILELTQSFAKHELKVDKIYFERNLEAVLYMGDITVLLGKCDELPDKLHEVKQMLPELQGLTGTLHLENYTTDQTSVIFKKEK